MARGEYGSSYVGNGVNTLPQATGFHRNYGDVFRERVEELDAAVQQADRDYAAKYQTDWHASGQEPGKGLDQSHFVFTYWLPFVKEWNATRARLLNQLLAGQIDRSDRGPALWLAYSAGRFNDLKQSAGASWGLDTTAPSVVIRGAVGAEPDRSSGTPWWKIAIGATVVLGAGYLVLRPIIKETNRTIGEVRGRVREIGIKPGMSQAEQDRTWDAYYAKRGLKLENGELVKIK